MQENGRCFNGSAAVLVQHLADHAPQVQVLLGMGPVCSLCFLLCALLFPLETHQWCTAGLEVGLTLILDEGC